jgi:hypothetical protein
VDFTDYAFNATGGTAPRTMPNRLADTINVKDFGALGNDTGDDAPAIQAAFNAAFGSSGSPHGSAGATSNRPVFIPNGTYRLNSALTLTRVVGGHIYGAGTGATILKQMTGGAVLEINGAANLVFENFNLIGGGSNGPMINLDWNGAPGGDGLHDNIFRGLLFANFSVGIVIANSNNAGHNNLFEMCTFNGGTVTGLEARGPNAINNTAIMGGAGGCAQGYWSSGGSIHCYENSNSRNVWDVRVDSGHPVVVIGGRGESDLANLGFLKCTSGLVTVRGYYQAGIHASAFWANITGGKVSFDACGSGNVITGNAGTLYLRGNSLGSASLLTGYSGTVAQNI